MNLQFLWGQFRGTNVGLRNGCTHFCISQSLLFKCLAGKWRLPCLTWAYCSQWETPEAFQRTSLSCYPVTQTFISNGPLALTVTEKHVSLLWEPQSLGEVPATLIVAAGLIGKLKHLWEAFGNGRRWASRVGGSDERWGHEGTGEEGVEERGRLKGIREQFLSSKVCSERSSAVRQTED